MLLKDRMSFDVLKAYGSTFGYVQDLAEEKDTLSFICKKLAVASLREQRLFFEYLQHEIPFKDIEEQEITSEKKAPLLIKLWQRFQSHFSRKKAVSLSEKNVE